MYLRASIFQDIFNMINAATGKAETIKTREDRTVFQEVIHKRDKKRNRMKKNR